MSWTLVDFIAESNRIEGMGEPTEREITAHENILELEKLTVPDLILFVGLVQPNAVLRRRAGLDVMVGNYIAPRGGPQIEEELTKLLGDVAYGASPYDIHLRYETLHPFTDGNGRSGRAVWLWQNNGYAPIGFLHRFYYDTLKAYPS